MLRILNPIKIIGAWILLMILIDLIVIPILYYKTVGGEQRPLTFLMESIDIALYGVLILSIVTTALYWSWTKKFWYVNLIFFLLSFFYIINDFKRNAEIPYSFNESTAVIDGSEIKIKREYYSLNPEKLRSESYWRDGKKDSIWTIFARDGSLIKQQKYKNDKLIE